MSWKLARAMLTAPPMVRPFTATMEGLGKSQNSRVRHFRQPSNTFGWRKPWLFWNHACASGARVGFGARPERSAPLLKALPWPVHTRHFTRSSFAACRRTDGERVVKKRVRRSRQQLGSIPVSAPHAYPYYNYYYYY